MSIDVKRAARIFFLVLSILLLAYGVFRVAVFPRWTVDDAYILFRYAENLADHGELNWNVGRDPVEGYTGLSMVGLLALAIKLGAPPVAAAHAICIAFYVLGALCIVLLLRGFNLAAAAALGLYTTAPFMYIHAWSGLETTMFATSILFALYAFMRGGRALLVVSLVWLAFVRPEGALLAVLMLLSLRPFSWKTAAWFAAPCVAYFAWRAIYYGHLLPTTYYAKSFAGDRGENAGMMRNFFVSYLALPSMLLVMLPQWGVVRGHVRLVCGTALFAAATVYIYLNADLVMDYQYRFMVPLYVVAAAAVGGVILHAGLRVKTLLLAAVLVAPQIAANLDGYKIKFASRYASTYRRMLESEHEVVGRYLREKMPPGVRLAVHADAGAIPYYSKLETVDFGGLNDEFLARRKPSIKEYVDYFFGVDAGVVVMTSYKRDRLDHGPEAAAISRDRRFERYVHVMTYDSHTSRKYFQFLYIRRDLADSLGIVATLPATRSPGSPAASYVRKAGPLPDTPALPVVSGMALNVEDLWTAAQEESQPVERIRIFEKIADQHPDDRHAPQALFMIGFIYAEELRRYDLAREAFEKLIGKYPGDEAVETARWMLEHMGRLDGGFERADSSGGT